MDSFIKTPIKANQDQLIMGHLLEPIAAYWYQQKTGNTVYNDTRKKIVSCLHRGTYKELAALYNEMMEWIKNNGYKPSGTSIEYYYSNPNVPEEEQVTRIEMPLL